MSWEHTPWNVAGNRFPELCTPIRCIPFVSRHRRTGIVELPPFLKVKCECLDTGKGAEAWYKMFSLCRPTTFSSKCSFVRRSSKSDGDPNGAVRRLSFSTCDKWGEASNRAWARWCSNMLNAIEQSNAAPSDQAVATYWKSCNAALNLFKQRLLEHPPRTHGWWGPGLSYSGLPQTNPERRIYTAIFATWTLDYRNSAVPQQFLLVCCSPTPPHPTHTRGWNISESTVDDWRILRKGEASWRQF